MQFNSKIWRYDGDAAWYFVTLPKDLSEDIRELSGPRRGFGSVPVVVSIRDESWKTSLFPDSKRQAYVLPMKKAVRASLGVQEGDSVEVNMELLTNE